MNVYKLNEIPKEHFDRPIFTGGKVHRQPLMTPEIGSSFNGAVVHFSKGARTVPHTHTSDQILIIASGKGIVGDHDNEIIAKPGDIIFSPAGVEHWHGATEDSEFSHIMILGSANKTQY